MTDADRKLITPEDMMWRLGAALERLLYGADDGTTPLQRTQAAIEAVDTWHRWSKARATVAETMDRVFDDAVRREANDRA